MFLRNLSLNNMNLNHWIKQLEKNINFARNSLFFVFLLYITNKLRGLSYWARGVFVKKGEILAYIISFQEE